MSAEDDITDAEMTIKVYNGKPASLEEEKSGEVYKYLKIETSNINRNLDKAVIELQVEKDWVEDNDLDTEKIFLFKYNESDDEWIEISTAYKDSDDDFYYYESILNSFSYFAIAEKTSSRVVASSNSTSNFSSGTTVPSTSTSSSNSLNTNANEREEDTSFSDLPAGSSSGTEEGSFFKDNSGTIILSTIVFALIAFVAAIALFFIKKVRRAEKDIGKFVEKVEKTAEKDLHKVEREAEKDLRRFEKKF